MSLEKLKCEMEDRGFEFGANPLLENRFFAHCDHFDEEDEFQLNYSFNSLDEVKMFIKGFDIAMSRVTGMPL